MLIGDMLFDCNALVAELQDYYAKEDYQNAQEFLSGIQIGIEQINPPYGVYEAESTAVEDQEILSEEGRIWTKRKDTSLAAILYEKGLVYEAAKDWESSRMCYEKSLKALKKSTKVGEGVYNRLIVQMHLDAAKENLKKEEA